MGDPGAVGDPGSPGLSGYERVVSPRYANPAGEQTLGSSDCPAGKTAISGGVEGTGGLGQSVYATWPSSNGTTWRAIVTNNDADAAGFDVYVICAVVR
jgi:hypothetical protein